MSQNSTLIYVFPSATIRRTVVSAMANNVYLITSKGTGAQILIDAADDAEAINALIVDGAADTHVPTSLKMIATTHQHGDHVRALAAIVSQSGALTVSGVEDAEGITAQTGVPMKKTVCQGEAIAVAGISLSCVVLRGHTPGSVAYILEDSSMDENGQDLAGACMIFSGDSLFPGGVGNTEKDPDRFTSLLNDVQTRLFDRFADASLVLPGHGAVTTLGQERPSLPEWRERGW